jgi:hypothetical protein
MSTNKNYTNPEKIKKNWRFVLGCILVFGGILYVTDAVGADENPRVLRGAFWSAKNLHDMISYWNETTARALLEEPGVDDPDLRLSIRQIAVTATVPLLQRGLLS